MLTAAELIAIIVAGAVALVGLCALFIWFSNSCLTLTKYCLKSPKIREEGVRVVHLSDLHGKSFGKKNRRLIRAVAAQRPDFIAFTGDVIHKYRARDIGVAKALVKELCSIAPVYYVSGNHEMRSKQYRQLKEELKLSGAVVLDDESAHVCGIEIFGANCANIKKGSYFPCGKEGYNLLLAHLPQYIARYSQAGYDAALCGHAHGGQWRIPFTRVGVYSPGQGMFPEYTCGVHECGNLKEVISRGLGNSECPVRLFNRPEVVVIDFRHTAQ